MNQRRTNIDFSLEAGPSEKRGQTGKLKGELVASSRSHEGRPQARWLALIQSVDQGHQGGEGGFAKVGSQLSLDGTGRRPVLPQVVGAEVSRMTDFSLLLATESSTRT